jgi:hypothetical protein
LVGTGSKIGLVARLLLVHHTSSPGLQAMFEAVVSGTAVEGIQTVEVEVRPALTAAAPDVLNADGYLLGTPANIGYMSGALKHFFDTIYYPCLEATARRPYALYVHGNQDTTGAVRAVGSIAPGLKMAAGARGARRRERPPPGWRRAWLARSMCHRRHSRGGDVPSTPLRSASGLVA